MICGFSGNGKLEPAVFDMLSEILNGGEILKGQKNYNLAMEVPASFGGASVDSVSTLTPGAAFCDECGAPQAPSDTCVKCGFKFIKPGKFCPKCGTKREG